jgi:hypothetical protein
MASQLFPLALQNAGLFEAIVALSQTYEAIHYTTEVRPTKEVLQHQGNALIKVRDQLNSPSEPLGEVVMLTILFLMGIHVGHYYRCQYRHRLIPPVPRR